MPIHITPCQAQFAKADDAFKTGIEQADKVTYMPISLSTTTHHVAQVISDLLARLMPGTKVPQPSLTPEPAD